MKTLTNDIDLIPCGRHVPEYSARACEGARPPLPPHRRHRHCSSPPGVVACGEMAEWSKAHAWKVCRRGTVSRVRIPFSPPPPVINVLKYICYMGLRLLSPTSSPTSIEGWSHRPFDWTLRFICQTPASRASTCAPDRLVETNSYTTHATHSCSIIPVTAAASLFGRRRLMLGKLWSRRSIR